jgi:hypothetical protein
MKMQILSLLIKSGVYILENTPPPPPGKYQPISFGGENMKRGRKKGRRKCNKKGRKRKEKGKKKEKIGSKKIK